MPDSKEGRHVGKECLGCANVARGLISTDVLLTGLHSHSVSDVTVLVLGDTDDATRHFALELIFACQVGRVGSTETHGDTESLHATDGDVCSHLTSRLADRQRQDVLDDDRANLLFSETIKELTIVAHVTESVWSLDNGSTDVVCVLPGEFSDIPEDEVNPESLSSSLDNIDCLGENAV